DPRPRRLAGVRDRGAGAGADRTRGGGQRHAGPRDGAGRGAPAVGGVPGARRGGRSGRGSLPDAAAGRGPRRGAGGSLPSRSLAAAWARVLRRLGQPAQGSGAERGADRGEDVRGGGRNSVNDFPPDAASRNPETLVPAADAGSRNPETL